MNCGRCDPPLLPVHINLHRLGGGRPRIPDRRCADAIFYSAHELAGSRQALDQTELCAHSTAHESMPKCGWKRECSSNFGKQESNSLDSLCGIDWDWLAMDGAMAKAPLGGEETGPNPDFPRQKRRETKRSRLRAMVCQLL